MADINIEKLRADILDRMDNSVLIERLSEGIRVKLESETRVTRAINQAFLAFVQGADPSRIPKLISIVTPSIDSGVGEDGIDGVADGVATYDWPENAFPERQMGGVLKIILNGTEYNVNEDDAVALESLRYYASSPFFESDYEAYAIDLPMKRIYVLEDVDLQTRIVEEPEQVADDDTYGSDSTSTLPVSESFFSNISQQALGELVRMAADMGADRSGREQQAAREEARRKQKASEEEQQERS